MKRVDEFFKNKKVWTYVLLAVMIVAQVSYITYCFAVKKKDFHSDEIWSYGPANSYETPFFYATDDWADQNSNEWLSGSVMTDYLSVQEGEQFAYGKIYENTSRDLHQPLYFFVLHTICSFFPEQFSWWYGFALNMVFFVIAQIFLFLLVRKVSKSDFLALLVCFAYGFSQAAINNYVYIRMYTMMTCLGLILAYLHAVIYKNPEKMKKILPIIWIVTVAGGLTHSFFLAFAGLLSACFCFYYLFRRDWKHLLAYAVVQLSAAGMVFLTYPHTLGHVQTYESRNNLNSGYGGFWFEYRYLIMHMCAELFGIEVSPFTSYFWIHVTEVLLVLLITVVPASFLLRNEKWFRSMAKDIWCGIKGLPKWLKTRCDWMTIMLALTAYGVVLVTARMAHVYMMGPMSTRYVFMVEPYIFMVLILLLFFVLDVLVKIIKWIAVRAEKTIKEAVCVIAKKVTGVVIVLLMLVNIFFNATESFYFEYDYVDFYLEEMPREANYILLLREYWLLDSACHSLYGTENFFAARYDNAFLLSDEFSKLKSDKPVYLIMDIPKINEIYNPKENEILDVEKDYEKKIGETMDVENEGVAEYLEVYKVFFGKLPFCEEFTYVGISEIFGREFFVFCLRQ